jgi:hypothetical protein
VQLVAAVYDRRLVSAMTTSIASRLIAYVFSLCLLGTSLGHADTALDLGNTNLSLREDGLCNGLITAWLTNLSDNSVPENVRKISALSLYAFTFQYWLVTVHQGKKNPILDKHEVSFIMRHVKSYVRLDDPMNIAPFYVGDNLNAAGLTWVSLQPLQHADDIFENKQTYEKLVAEFAQWRDDQK